MTVSELTTIMAKHERFDEFLDEIDLFVAVPLHWRRRLERGYNQSLILCKGIEGAKGRISGRGLGHLQIAQDVLFGVTIGKKP